MMNISSYSNDELSLIVRLQEDLLRRHAIGIAQLARRDIDSLYDDEQVRAELIPGASTRTTNFVCESLESAELLISVGANTSPVPIVRAAYESAAKLVWASGELEGWKRCLARFCYDDIKMANNLLQLDPMSAHGERLKKHRAEQLDIWAQANSAELPPCPPFEQLLVAIDKQDGLLDIHPLYPFDGAWHYANMYRPLSTFAHGHWISIGFSDQSAARIACALGFVFCAQSLCVVATRLSKELHESRSEIYKQRIMEQYRMFDAIVEMDPERIMPE